MSLRVFNYELTAKQVVKHKQQPGNNNNKNKNKVIIREWTLTLINDYIWVVYIFLSFQLYISKSILTECY